MTRPRRVLPLLILATLLLAPAAHADLDRAAVDFTTAGDIKWVRNAAGTAESAVLFHGGKVHYDGAKGEETVIQVWGVGPATSTPVGPR